MKTLGEKSTQRYEKVLENLEATESQQIIDNLDQKEHNFRKARKRSSDNVKEEQDLRKFRINLQECRKKQLKHFKTQSKLLDPEKENQCLRIVLRMLLIPEKRQQNFIGSKQKQLAPDKEE